jgi:NCAIR mutase (PurE)-related protein
MERGLGGLYTRLDAARGQALLSRWPESEWHPRSGLLMLPGPRPLELVGEIAVICAGTSDLPVAEEAALVARYAGHRVVQYTDVGVAGLHRLLTRIEAIRRAHALVVVAGMEGALPSVVAGLVDRPIIAVPTSVGYGASFGGLAALLAMLNACAPGVTVVNIDNGFGAAVVATQINRLALGLR